MRRRFRDRELKNIKRYTKGGRVYLYHRKTGARLPDLPMNDPAFVAAWLEEEKAEKGFTTRAAKGTIAAACEVLKASRDYLDLSVNYQRVIDRHLSAIRMAYGDAPARGLAQRHIEADLSRLPPNPANARLKAWRLLCRVNGIQAAAGVMRRKTPKTDGHKPWSADHVAAYREAWPVGSVQRLAFELIHWTGARVSDAVRLSPSMVDANGLLVFRQAKTKNLARVPWACPLPSWAAEWDQDRKMMMTCLSECHGFTYLETHGNRVRSHYGLSGLIRDAARSAGVERSAHGLRKTRLSAIAEAGGSAHAIMSWGGHVTIAEAQEYCRQADLSRLLIGQEVSTVSR